MSLKPVSNESQPNFIQENPKYVLLSCTVTVVAVAAIIVGILVLKGPFQELATWGWQIGAGITAGGPALLLLWGFGSSLYFCLRPQKEEPEPIPENPLHFENKESIEKTSSSLAHVDVPEGQPNKDPLPTEKLGRVRKTPKPKFEDYNFAVLSADLVNFYGPSKRKYKVFEILPSLDIKEFEKSVCTADEKTINLLLLPWKDFFDLKLSEIAEFSDEQLEVIAWRLIHSEQNGLEPEESNPETLASLRAMTADQICEGNIPVEGLMFLKAEQIKDLLSRHESTNLDLPNLLFTRGHTHFDLYTEHRMRAFGDCAFLIPHMKDFNWQQF